MTIVVIIFYRFLCQLQTRTILFQISRFCYWLYLLSLTELAYFNNTSCIAIAMTLCSDMTLMVFIFLSRFFFQFLFQKFKFIFFSRDTAVKIFSYKTYFQNIFPFPFPEMSSPKCNLFFSKRKKINLSPVHRIEEKNHIPKHAYIL